MRPREFEFLVAHIYRRMGYEVEVTPLQKDRGKDVIARKPGEVVFIECKNWRGRVNSDVVAALTGRVEMDRVTRGVVVGTSGFTSGHASATEVASFSPARMSLCDGDTLVRLLNQHCGSEWHRRLERLVFEERLAQKRRRQAT
ncbi:restriction endonuclease [Arthrobacter sp. CAN_C5]|uniref:restriction endonuclease n=1 Tax=Arthrobacter sp. CAN_C5 TaxID=2760706 RepID=UPI0037BE3BC8